MIERRNMTTERFEPFQDSISVYTRNAIRCNTILAHTIDYAVSRIY